MSCDQCIVFPHCQGMWHHSWRKSSRSSIRSEANNIVGKLTCRCINHGNPKGSSFRIAGIFNGIKIRDIYLMSMLPCLPNGISKIKIRSLPCWDSHRVIAPSLCCLIQPLPIRGKHLISVLNITGVWFPNWAIAHNEIAGLPPTCGVTRKCAAINRIFLHRCVQHRQTHHNSNNAKTTAFSKTSFPAHNNSLRNPVYRREVANLVNIEEACILTEGNYHYYLVWLKPRSNRNSVFALNPK